MSSKKGSTANKKAFRPGTESRETFCLVLEILADMLKNKKIDLEIGAKCEFEFSISPPEIKEIVHKKIEGHIDFDDFMAIISTEIEALIAASIFSDKSKGIKKHIPLTILKDVGIEEFIWRLNEIEKTTNLSTDQKRDLLFQKTTKGLIIKEAKWEIVNKIFDEDLGQLSHLKYASLSILYSQPTAESYGARLMGEGFSIQLPTVSEPKTITLDLQKKDIKGLIEKLESLLESFGD